jgi:SAM-dependent methyltransferase
VKKSQYQKELSLASPILLDSRYKQPKVAKMISILSDTGAVSDTQKMLAIDIGCSRGFFTSGLAPYFYHVMGVDIDTHALKIARSENTYSNIHYIIGDSMNLPLEDNSVDLIVCNHVYEHVPNAEKLFAEIHRVLSVDGVCYLGAASRLTVVEPHYHLPFLSWFPKSLAHIYMRIAGKGDSYYENLRTYWGIRRLISGFDVLDYTLRVIAQPDRFNARDLLPQGGLLEKIPCFVWKLFYSFLPSYILILKKRHR